MSPRAACRLETLGFEHVYDYMPGKVDWLARGLPREGELAGAPRAIDLVRRDVVTCLLGDRIADVAQRVAASPYRFAFVLSESGVVLGRLRRAVLEGDPDTTAEAVMEPGPSTVRAHTTPSDVRRRLEDKGFKTAVITNPDGVLLGIVCIEDLPS